jgi:hypothetical protein
VRQEWIPIRQDALDLAKIDTARLRAPSSTARVYAPSRPRFSGSALLNGEV